MKATPFKVSGKLSKSDKAHLKTLKVIVATPAYGGNFMMPYVSSFGLLEKYAQKIGLKIDRIFIANESLIPRARNTLTHEFLQSDATHLMFIDADIRFRARDLVSMLLEKVHIIGGIYPRKEINWERVALAVKRGIAPIKLAHCSGNFVINPIKEGQKFKPFEISVVKYLGTGFMLISRDTIEQLKRNQPKYLTPDNKELSDFFPIGPTDDASDGYLSEDYYFSKLARKAGISTHVAPWVQLTHTGTYEFEGCFWCSQGVHIHDIR